MPPQRRVGDVVKLGSSSRLFLIGGPPDLMPEEGLSRTQKRTLAAIEVRPRLWAGPPDSRSQHQGVCMCLQQVRTCCLAETAACGLQPAALTSLCPRRAQMTPASVVMGSSSRGHTAHRAWWALSGGLPCRQRATSAATASWMRAQPLLEPGREMGAGTKGLDPVMGNLAWAGRMMRYPSGSEKAH